MGVLKAATLYFVRVFGAGFLLAFVRIPFLVPAFGVRTAELMEMPFMLAVICWASRRLVDADPAMSRSRRLAAGVLAFACLVTAELALAYLLSAVSPRQYIASRDPVSGGVYLASLVVFAIAPALWNNRSAPDAAVQRMPR